MELEREYGVATTIYFPVIKAGSNNFAQSADYTYAAGDIKILKDGAGAANPTNTPAFIVMGNTSIMSLALTATEMQAAQIFVTLSDAATKAIEDQAIPIVTYGNASALHAFNRNVATPAVNVTQLGGSTQSATDLQDFADAGYDPATNQVEGVKTADVATTVTNAVNLNMAQATPPTPASDTVGEALRFAHQSLPNAAAGGSGGLPTVDASNRIAGIQGTKNILDDLNDINAATVKAQADQALVDIHLDHLLATDTGASLPGAPGAIFQDLLEDDAGTWRYNANALEQAPTGATPLTQQEVRDAMKLAPTAGAPAAGSVDAHLDDILDDTGTTGVLVADKNGYNLAADQSSVTVGTVNTVATVTNDVNLNMGQATPVSPTADTVGEALRFAHQSLPNAAAGGSGGLPTVDASNRIAGIQGTKNTLDDLNDINAATVKAQADQALVDIHLDHLLATDTGASLPGTPGAIFQDLLEDDAGTWRYNANALEQAPSGGGALTQQDVRDAMKLAPTAGAPAAGSVDEHLDSIVTEVNKIGIISDLGSGTTIGANLSDIDGTGTAIQSTLGTPAGASMSADIASIKADSAAILVDTDNILTKLLKYVRLIVRKDAGIAVDHSVELIAINGDAGSGPGAYDNTTDSQEAIRDRGDAAWTTGIGGGGFESYLHTGTAQAGALATITLDTGASSVSEFYIGQRVILKSGTGAGQSRIISGYNGATRLATVHPSFKVAPDNTTVFEVWSGDSRVGLIQEQTDAVSGLTAAFDGTGGVSLSLSRLVVTHNHATEAAVHIENINAGSGLLIESSGGDALVAGSGSGRGIVAQGGGTGAGIEAYGGQNGAPGAYFVGGSGSVSQTAHGIHLRGSQVSSGGFGLFAEGGVNGSGIVATGAGTGHGLAATGGSSSGNAIYALANVGDAFVAESLNGRAAYFNAAGSFDGIRIEAGTSGHGVKMVGGGSGAGLSADGGATGAGISATGSGTSAGIEATGGSTSGSGISAIGAASGDGVRATGGATGNGMQLLGGATSGDGLKAGAQTLGDGLRATGVGASSAGIRATSNGSAGLLAVASAGNSHGIDASGFGSGSGLRATGGATGHGVNGNGGSTSGHGAYFLGSPLSGDGLRGFGNTTGAGIRGIGAGNLAGIRGEGQGSAPGIRGIGGATGPGAYFNGQGSGPGLLVTGGATGHGLQAAGGSSSGSGVSVSATTGIGIDVAAGTGQHAVRMVGNGAGSGLYVQGGATSQAAILASGQGSGAGIRSEGGATGHGAHFIAGASGGNGLQGTAQAGDGSGAAFNGAGAGAGFQAIGGTSGGPGGYMGGGTGSASSTAHGLILVGSGSSTGGSGLKAQGGSSNPGILAIGSSAGAGFRAEGGATAPGAYFYGGALGTAGLVAQGQTNGHGVQFIGVGTGLDIDADTTTEALKNAFADNYLRRGVANLGGTHDQDSPARMLLAVFHANTVDNPGFLTIYEPDNVTLVEQVTLAVDPAADPIVGTS